MESGGEMDRSSTKVYCDSEGFEVLHAMCSELIEDCEVDARASLNPFCELSVLGFTLSGRTRVSRSRPGTANPFSR